MQVPSAGTHAPANPSYKGKFSRNAACTAALRWAMVR